ncbi:MAG: transporter substrate-binding domain-containing protein [Actinomycetota bacterium]
MRRFITAVAAFGLILAACAKDNPAVTSGGSTGTSGASGASGSSGASGAASCSTDTLSLVNAGQLTIGTDNPAYPPYFAGGETKDNPDWKFNDPYTGKGFEDAVAYEVASRLGFDTGQVQWVVAPFNQTYKPGPTNYDFAIEQISYSAKRAQAVDFSESYYDVNQAVVGVKGSPITQATSIADLKAFSLAAPIGTTSYDFIVNTIQPNSEAGAYNSLSDSVAALNAGQVDGIVVDLPTALYLADPFVQEVKNGVVVGQFATAATGEYFGLTFAKGSSLVACVNQALDAMKSDGTLAQITTTWLSQKTNVGEVPVLT